ncbi:MAG: type II toxin-antitoxin system YoeB family toxin [Aeriscardovia sp.]|nr:type II toxin-antitoxin system YoeB family toxin [Aeriscardovia sp.]
MGEPEPLTGGLFGYWSQRANGEDRLICRVDVDNTYALPCRFHYVDRQLRLLCEGYDN